MYSSHGARRDTKEITRQENPEAVGPDAGRFFCALFRWLAKALFRYQEPLSRTAIKNRYQEAVQ
jgi:hypothetical protein